MSPDQKENTVRKNVVVSLDEVRAKRQRKVSEQRAIEKERKAIKRLQRDMNRSIEHWDTLKGLTVEFRKLSGKVMELLQRVSPLAVNLQDEAIIESVRATAIRAAKATQDFHDGMKVYADYKGGVGIQDIPAFNQAMNDIMNIHIPNMENLMIQILEASELIEAKHEEIKQAEQVGEE